MHASTRLELAHLAKVGWARRSSVVQPYLDEKEVHAIGELLDSIVDSFFLSSRFLRRNVCYLQ